MVLTVTSQMCCSLVVACDDNLGVEELGVQTLSQGSVATAYFPIREVEKPRPQNATAHSPSHFLFVCLLFYLVCCEEQSATEAIMMNTAKGRVICLDVNQLFPLIQSNVKK